MKSLEDFDAKKTCNGILGIPSNWMVYIMIFELFLAFAILSCIFIFLGYYTKPEIKVLAILGFATLFFLGLALQFGGITQKTGETHANTYVCQSCSGNSIPALAGSNSTSQISSVISTYNYDVINDDLSIWIGRWLSIVSVLGASLVFASNRGDEK